MPKIKIVTLLLTVVMFWAGSCSKDETPVIIATLEIRDITTNSARSGAKIVYGELAEIQEKGLVWGINNDPTTENSSGIILFNIIEKEYFSEINNLEPEINNIYGKLYNWYTISDDRGLCPAGWHVPSDDEWKELEHHLGMRPSSVERTGLRDRYAGGKLKEKGTDNWSAPNILATDELGFRRIFIIITQVYTGISTAKTAGFQYVA